MSIEPIPGEVRLASVLMQVPAFVAVLQGPDHVFRIANPAYLRLVPDRDPVGRPVREVFPEAEYQPWLDLLDRVYATGEPFVGTEIPMVFEPSSGSIPVERYLNFVYQPDRLESGAVQGIIVHGVDVTDQVQARRMAEAQADELQEQASLLEHVQEGLEAANRRLADANRDAEESRARLAALIEQMPSGVLMANASDGSVVLSNRQAEIIWRHATPPPNGEGWDRYDAYRPDGSRYLRGEWPLERALQGELISGEQLEIVRPDGSRGVISVSSAPIRDQAGEVIAAVAVFDDVTERARHETEQAFLVETARVLASSLDYEQTLRSVAELAVPTMADWCEVHIVEEGVPQRLAAVHADPRKERLADQLARRWPSDPVAPGLADVLGTGAPEIFPEVTDDLLRSVASDEEHLETLREMEVRSLMIVPMVARGRTLGSISLILTRPGRLYDHGDLRVGEKLATRAAMAIDNAMLFRQVERSLDEAEIAKQRAEEARRLAEIANKAKSDFLANMSHEMRTPLNAITGYMELLEMQIGGPLTDQQKSHLERMRRSAQHLLALINDLLDLARIESGRLRVEEEMYPAAEAVEAAISLILPQAEAGRLEIVQECASESGAKYVGDRDRVRQVLVNLLGNAVKFTPPGGRISVSCGRAQGTLPNSLRGEGASWTFIRVTDTGIGIESAELERIFLAFEQVQEGYTREVEGAGLGLSISRQLALLMGGELTAESAPGAGSSFTLWLPSSTPLEPLDPQSVANRSGLAPLGTGMLAEIERALERYSTRLREDPEVPLARKFNEAEILDHHSSLATDIAATLIALGEPSEGSDQVLQDSSEIQRLMAELHGRQRAQLGWSEAALHREFEIWGEELYSLVLTVPAPGVGTAEREQAARVIGQLVTRVRRASLRAFRAARAASGPLVP